MNAERFDLSGKRAVVTGGSRGIGFAISRAYAEAGASVGLVARSPESLKQAIDAINTQRAPLFAFAADLGQMGDVARVAQVIQEQMGDIDILVNNAGVIVRHSIAETTEEEWDRLMDVNLKGVFFLSRALYPGMKRRGGGVIINMSSVNAHHAGANRAAYCTSKGGLSLLTQSMAIEWAPDGIRANAIAPGFIATDLNAEMRQDPANVEPFIRRTPLKRLGAPEDIESLALFLASEASAFVTGQTIYIDGGATA